MPVSPDTEGADADKNAVGSAGTEATAAAAGGPRKSTDATARGAGAAAALIVSPDTEGAVY